MFYPHLVPDAFVIFTELVTVSKILSVEASISSLKERSPLLSLLSREERVRQLRRLLTKFVRRKIVTNVYSLLSIITNGLRRGLFL